MAHHCEPDDPAGQAWLNRVSFSIKEKLIVPTGTSAVVNEKHAVLLGKVFLQYFYLIIVEANIALADHVNHGRTLAFRNRFSCEML